MEEACDRMDIDSNNKISVFEFHQVCLLLNGTKQANFLQEVMAKKFGKEKTRCGNANKIYRMIHRNMRTGMTKPECFVGLIWLKAQLRLIGPPHVIISDLDQNNDGKLSKGEFSMLGRLLNPALSRPRMEGLFVLLDVDPNDEFVTEKELKYEEECADPYGCGGGGSSGPTRMDVTSEDMQKYHNVPAIIAGRATVTFEMPTTTEPPPDSQLGDVVGKKFTQIFSEEMDTHVTVQDVTSFHKGHALQKLKLNPDMRGRLVVINFEIDVNDGGAFQDKLQAKASDIHARCVDEIAKEENLKAQNGGAWLHQSELGMFGSLTASYYKTALPDGQTLYQDYGMKPGDQAPLRTIPYTYHTTVVHREL